MMNRARLIPLVVLACASCGPAESSEVRSTTPAPDPDAPSADIEAEVLSTLQTLFDALATGDGVMLRSVVDSDLVMRFSETTTEGETSFGSSTVDGLVARIEGGSEPLVERMWEPVVRVSGSMATIWTPYDFYVGSTFSHCGVDAATLMNTEDGWKIVGLTWTRLQPPECSLHPAGPPAS